MGTKTSPSTLTISPPATSTSEERRSDALAKEVDARLPMADIEAAIRGIRFGVVQIIIQDGVVVQIDRTEKSRLR